MDTKAHSFWYIRESLHNKFHLAHFYAVILDYDKLYPKRKYLRYDIMDNPACMADKILVH